MSGFISLHDVWDEEHQRKAKEVLAEIERDNVELVRFSFPDLHGVLRGKALTPLAIPGAMRDGVSITSSLLLKDTSHRTAVAIFEQGAGIGDKRLQGAGDVIMVPDPFSYRKLPWAPGTAMMLCDLYYPDGTLVEYATRQIGRKATKTLADHGYQLICGLEVEFHLFKLEEQQLGISQGSQPGLPPAVSLTHTGYNYLTDQRFDELSPIIDILRRDLTALGLPLTSVEIEFGPSQCELVFKAVPGLQAADNMVMLRTAVKQISRRHGYHASFMCRPAFANAMASGWHLHQSLASMEGENLFGHADGPGLSPLAEHYIAGLLDNAEGLSAFNAPTINAYKRYRPNSLAPNNIAWARDNRGAMLRIIDRLSRAATRVENRAGEPNANPYLYIFTQALAGLSGIAAGLTPPDAVETPYGGKAQSLPSSLEAALRALDRSTFARATLGDAFVDYFLLVKRFEVQRFNTAITDWEHNEYFDVF